MILQIMAVHDSKARCFMVPFFVSHVDVGLRTFAGAVNEEEKQTQLAQHPDDFTLYHLGSYNDENGAFLVSAQPVHVAFANDVKKGVRNVQHKVA